MDMNNTRVEKYKGYRAKLISEGDPVHQNAKDGIQTNSFMTSSTLPIKEVYKTLEEEEQQENALLEHQKKQALIRNIFIGIALGLVAIGLIIFAIFAFKS